MTLPTVAIIIPTRNRLDELTACLRQLMPYVMSHPECRLIVADDGDAVQTSEALTQTFGHIQVVQGPRRGPAANRNCGASHSAEDLLIFLDDDCTPHPQLIPAYQEAALSHPDVRVFEGRITAVGAVTTFADTAPSNETGGYLWSCNFAIQRELFVQVGGFDERFPFAAVEDVDFHFRVKKESAIIFLPDARVSHKIEAKLGWRIVQHHTLSVLLFLHIHGLQATNKTPLFFLRMAIKSLLTTGSRHLRAGTAKHPSYLLHRVWANLVLSFIILLWKSRPALSRWFFPPCCQGCESIHAVLSSPNLPWLPLHQRSDAFQGSQ